MTKALAVAAAVAACGWVASARGADTATAGAYPTNDVKAMEKRLDELNREWETVVADEDRLRLEVRNAFEGSRKLAEQARTTDPEIARMTNRIAQLEGELKQLKKDLDRRLSAIPGLREQRDQMRVFSMKLADLQTRKEKLRQERNRVSGLVYSLKQGKKP